MSDDDDHFTEATRMSAIGNAIMDLMQDNGLNAAQCLKLLCILLGASIQVWGIDKCKLQEEVFNAIRHTAKGDYDA